jgi:hypothetical protein
MNQEQANISTVCETIILMMGAIIGSPLKPAVQSMEEKTK